MNAGQGVTARSPDSLLTARARDFLATGPADPASLVARVCQLPGVPPAVAAHLADTLLGAHPEFVRMPDGRWTLVSALGSVLVSPLDAPPVLAGPPVSPSADAFAGFVLDSTAADARAAGVAREIEAAGAAGAAAEGEPLSGMSFVVVDVETTGGRPLGGDRVTEFAAVVVRGGSIAESYETLLNPDRAIPPWISRLTQISWEMVREAPRFRDVCEDVMRVIGGHVFVAHNASFDWGFVSMEMARATGQELSGRQLCTVRLARRLLPQLRRRSLDYVADHYNVNIAARHRAMGDARATAHVLIGLLRDAESRGCTTWGDLQRLLATSTSTRRRRRPSALPGPVTRDTTA